MQTDAGQLNGIGPGQGSPAALDLRVNCFSMSPEMRWTSRPHAQTGVTVK